METKRVHPLAVGKIERLGELPRVHRRRADVAHLSRLHHVVQRFQRLLDGRFVVPAMNLVEVHVVGLQALQALVEFEEDGLAREAASVGLVAHHAMDLGRDHHRLAAHVGLQKPAQHRLALAARVDIGGIEEIDAQIECLPQERFGFFFVQRPCLPSRQQFARGRATVGHASEADARNFESGMAKIDVFHRCSCFEFSGPRPGW